MADPTDNTIPFRRKAGSYGGHNKRLAARPAAPAGTDGLKTEEPPWLRKPGTRWWSRRRIFRYLSDQFAARGMTVAETHADIVSALATHHFFLSQALGAIKRCPPAGEPKVGSRCAHSVAAASHKNIIASMRALRSYPTEAGTAGPNQAQQPSNPLDVLAPRI